MAIQEILDQLTADNQEMLLLMVVSPDGLTLAYSGNVEDFEKVGALYIELKLMSENIMSQLHYGDMEEIIVRSRNGVVQLTPLVGGGILACLAKPSVNSLKLQMKTWRAASKLKRLL